MRVAVIGAGIVGLTTAHELLSSGHDVALYYGAPPLNTTSAIATAVWHVYLVDPKDERNLNWASHTLSRLNALSSVRGTGVYPVEGLELFRRGTAEIPTWSNIPSSFRMLSDAETRRYPGVTWGYRLRAPLAEMSVYMRWLFRAVWRGGAQLTFGQVNALEDLGSSYDAIINCAGLEARELVGDRELTGVRGQYLVLERPARVSSLYIGDDQNERGMTYVIPRRNEVMVGGTEEYGVEEVRFEVDVKGLLDRAGELVPWVRDERLVAIRETVVGLRPWRPSGVRFGLSRVIGSCQVVDNFGHGGSGFSLSWGCARSVLELLESA